CLRVEPARPRRRVPRLRPRPFGPDRDRSARASGTHRERVMPLAFYSRAANEEFWSEHWGGQDVDRLVRIASTSPLTTLLEDALPTTGPILEAGCGLGQYVILLRQRRHAVIGADWSPEALQRSKKAVASSPLSVMDLSRLAVRDGAFAAYISLGVVEHDQNGPDAIVAEAARVLSPGGRLLLSVPYWNGARRLLTRRLVRHGDEVRAAGCAVYPVPSPRGEGRAVRGG